MLVADGIENNHGEPFSIGRGEGLEIDEARHRSGTLFHTRSQLAVAVSLGVLMQARAKDGNDGICVLWFHRTIFVEVHLTCNFETTLIKRSLIATERPRRKNRVDFLRRFALDRAIDGGQEGSNLAAELRVWKRVLVACPGVVGIIPRVIICKIFGSTTNPDA